MSSLYVLTHVRAGWERCCAFILVGLLNRCWSTGLAKCARVVYVSVGVELVGTG